MNDPLGDRMKGNYEDRTRIALPRRTYTILRLDGKAFHTYTRGLKKPFDKDLSEDIDNAIVTIMPKIQGAEFAYTQSDEISILLTDFEKTTTDAWFDGNLQKICSVAASLMTAEFNKYRWTRSHMATISAYFDCRVFTIPDRIEVMNYFIWRNNDCARNSLSMVAQANFSHSELQGKSSPEMHEMLHAKGVNWATGYTDGEKNGRLIVKEVYTAWNRGAQADGDICQRSHWVARDAWKFTEDKDRLLTMIPEYTRDED